MRIKYLAAALLALTSVGCGSEDDGDEQQNPGTEQCEGQAQYVAFDPVNHEPQDKRLGAIDEMLALFAAVQADPTTAAAKAAEVRAIYESTDHNLRAKVQGRQDVHLTDDAAMVGPAIDDAIVGAIDDLAAATTALEANLAKQTFEKSGIYRFLYLSVMYELYEPSKKHYDEAFGYYGSGNTDTDASRRGLARLAAKRDGNNDTTLASELFALVLDGKCALADALAAAGTDTIEMGTDATYDDIVDQIDARLQLVMAYSIGHELIEFEADKADADTAAIKIWEADGFFDIVEPYLASGTTEEQQFAADFRAALDDAMSKVAAGDTSWIATFDGAGFLETVESIYGIDVKG
ncbi:hypothetical protein [Vulgatibacter sp.]|uniref:hypothetical protein n=1 Tax=Vulgatibacter sp. TaxID=1971226 RepID=UPI0035643A8A